MWTEAAGTGLAAGHIMAAGYGQNSHPDMDTALVSQQQLLQYNNCICTCSSKTGLMIWPDRHDIARDMASVTAGLSWLYCAPSCISQVYSPTPLTLYCKLTILGFQPG